MYTFYITVFSYKKVTITERMRLMKRNDRISRHIDIHYIDIHGCFSFTF